MIIEPIFLPIRRSPKNSPVGSQRGNRLEFSNVILLELLNGDKRSIIEFAAGFGFWDLLLMPIWDCLPLLLIGKQHLEYSFGTIFPCCEVSMRAFLCCSPRTTAQLQPYFLQTLRWNSLFWTFLPYGSYCTPIQDCRQFHDTTPYGTCSNKSSPIRALQTNHFLNTKKQSSSFKNMHFQMRKSAQTRTLMQRT